MGRADMMDYSHKCSCSASGSVASATSSSSRSSNGGTIKHGLRTVHLKRQSGVYLEGAGRDKYVANVKPNNFGFSFRGGSEFGTGFFISAVEPDSDAYFKGLKIGDQIMRINGLPVEAATHQEVLQLAQAHQQLTLTVKSVGVIPVKDKCEDILTWRLVDHSVEDQLMHSGYDVDRVVIDIPDNTKLGCGICKGPDWRPGIFVQYTKPNSLARKCGLQPGDQILQCNRTSFLQIDFAYAVSILKNLTTLDLVVRKGSGIDLFPGESSGYSSASSVADEAVCPPPPPPLKRLSIVDEETEDRNQRNNCHCSSSNLKAASSIESIFNKYERTSLKHKQRSKSIEILTDPGFKKVTIKNNNNNISRTFVNFDETKRKETVIKIENNDTGSSLASDSSDAYEKVQVVLKEAPIKPPPPAPIMKSPSTSSFSSSNSLCSAISEEIQKRRARQLQGDTGKYEIKTELLKPANKVQREQHDLLIAELKKKQDRKPTQQTVVPAAKTTMDEQDRGWPRAEVKQPVKYPAPKPPPPPPPPVRERTDSPPDCPTPDYYSDTSFTEDTARTVKSSILKFEEKNKLPPKTVTFGQNSTKEITPVKNLIRGVTSKNFVICEKTPHDLVEMQSIESYDLTDPKLTDPKPPHTYFQPANRNDLKETKPRPTIIQITEYPTSKMREPGKFDFLGQEGDQPKAFENELASTLSRSNLKTKVDTFATNGSPKPKEAPVGSPKYNGFQGVQFIPTHNHLSNVKKSLKTFDKVSNNTVLVKIPSQH